MSCLSVCVCLCLSVSVCVCLCVCPYICLSVCPTKNGRSSDPNPMTSTHFWEFPEMGKGRGGWELMTAHLCQFPRERGRVHGGKRSRTAHFKNSRRLTENVGVGAADRPFLEIFKKRAVAHPKPHDLANFRTFSRNEHRVGSRRPPIYVNFPERGRANGGLGSRIAHFREFSEVGGENCG